MASVYNDPEHSEPFDITLPVPPDRNVQVWIFQTAIDQLSITAQDQAFQSGHNLYFLVLYCFSDLQTVELFISSLVLMKKSWGSNCRNYQVFLPYMWPIIKFSKLWSSTANQHSYKTLSAAALYFSTYFFFWSKEVKTKSSAIFLASWNTASWLPNYIWMKQYIDFFIKKPTHLSYSKTSFNSQTFRAGWEAMLAGTFFQGSRQDFQANWMQQPEQEGTWSGIGQFLQHIHSQFLSLSYYINYPHIPCFARSKWNFLDQRTGAKIRLWNGNKISETCGLLQQRKPSSTDCSSVRGVKDGPILVHYCLATQFETEVLPIVVASKEQEPQPPIYHAAWRLHKCYQQHPPLPRTAASHCFW